MRCVLSEIGIINRLNQSQAGKCTTLLFFLIALALALGESACVTAKRPATPQISMLLNIESTPSGASVFSYKDGTIGSQVGTTPLEITVGASMDFDGTNYYFWSYSPDDIITVNKKENISQNIYDFYLTCTLLKDGFQTKYIKEQYVTGCVARYGIDFIDQKQTLHFVLEKDDEPKSEAQQQ